MCEEEYQDLGAISYDDAFRLQEKLREERIAGKIGNRMLLLEHPPVFTLGKRDCGDDFVSPRSAIEADGIEIVKSNRGGRVTYHGPGQLVGYFICSLDSLKLGVKEFVWSVEEICRLTLSEFGIEGARDSEHPGIWVGRKKIAAVGLHFSHGVSMHGFALNVSPDLKHFRHIIACGIKDRGVTSMAIETKDPVQMQDVKNRVARIARKVFSDVTKSKTQNLKMAALSFEAGFRQT